MHEISITSEPKHVPLGPSLRTRLLLKKLESGGYPAYLVNELRYISALSATDGGFPEEELYQLLVFLTAFYEAVPDVENGTGR